MFSALSSRKFALLELQHCTKHVAFPFEFLDALVDLREAALDRGMDVDGTWHGAKIRP